MRKPLSDRHSTWFAKMAGSRPAMTGLDLATLATLAGAVLAAAACAGSDASWDLRNYHLYDGYAVLHGRLGVDLAPAQLQTFYAPISDAAYWLLLQALNGAPRLLNVVMALPQAIAVCLSWAIARCFLSRPQALLSTVISATGAATVSTLASTMSEAPMIALDLGALWLVLRRPERGFGAGMLTGIAVGLKLTAAPYAIGLVAASVAGRFAERLPERPRIGRRGMDCFVATLLGRRWWARAKRSPTSPNLSAPKGGEGQKTPVYRPRNGSRPVLELAMTLRLMLGVALGAGLCAGWWWFLLWRHYGNPVFPYFNDLFQSPWAEPARLNDLRFMARGPLQALVYPFFWALHPTTLVSELPLREPRLALALIAVPLALLRPCRPSVPLAVFFLTSLGFWEAQFSIFRYLATLELLSGTLIVLAFRRFSWLVAPAIIIATIYPNWGRTTGQRAVAVGFPPVPASSRVVLLDPSPMAYLAAFAPPGVRFIGADNNLIRPGQSTRLAEGVAAAIQTGSGPLWGLEDAAESPGVADATLRAFGLTRGAGCQYVQSNLDGNAILACPLVSANSGRILSPPRLQRDAHLPSSRP
jgi:hypothetical protein